ncbi:MAG: NusG domain II-containing protein [Oscillospiraceae bacterium]|nr:NusG domain II-containing protein [Ruminococcus sp.]
MMKRSAAKRLIRKRDAAIIIMILLTGIICFAGYKLFSPSGRTAVITINGKTAEKLSLTESGGRDITLKEAEGIVIEINNGRIRVKSADCPDKICVNTGYISKVGERIVCLPKKLIIEIKAEE